MVCADGHWPFPTRPISATRHPKWHPGLLGESVLDPFPSHPDRGCNRVPVVAVNHPGVHMPERVGEDRGGAGSWSSTRAPTRPRGRWGGRMGALSVRGSLTGASGRHPAQGLKRLPAPGWEGGKSPKRLRPVPWVVALLSCVIAESEPGVTWQHPRRGAPPTRLNRGESTARGFSVTWESETPTTSHPTT